MYKKFSNKKFWLSVVLALLVSLTGAFGSALAAGAPIGDMFPISVKREQEKHPSGAYNSRSGEYLVVFFNDRAGNDDIRAVRLSRAGKVLGEHWVSSGAGAERQYPDVVYNFDQREYLVVWEHHIPPSGSTPAQHSIRGRRLSEIGEPKGLEIVIANPASRGNVGKPVVDYSTTSKYYMAVWESQMWSQSSKSIYAQLLGGNGALMGGNFPLAQGSNDLSFRNPDLAYNRGNNNYLVAWERLDKSTKDIDIYGKLVRADGIVLPNTDKILWGANKETNPSVAALPNYEQKGQFIVVAESQIIPPNKDIAARRVYGDGSLLGASLVSNNPFFDEINPSVAGSEADSQYLVTWSMPMNEREPLSMIYAETVSPYGGPQGDYTAFILPFSTYSSAVSGPLGNFLVATQFENKDGWHIIGRLWGSSP